MHLTLKQDLLKNPAGNFLQQQEIFDGFKHDFNYERPHAALSHETPGSIFKPSSLKYKSDLGEIRYPHCEKVKRIFQNGKVNLRAKVSSHICLSLAGQTIGLTEIEEDVWRLQFLDIVLGHYDEKEHSFQPMKEIVRI